MPRAEEEAVRQDRELIRVSPALRYFAVGPRHNAGTQWSAASRLLRACRQRPRRRAAAPPRSVMTSRRFN